MSHLLEVKGLSKSFKKHFWSPRSLVLKDLSFTLPKSSATGFLGDNGSGKTTSFKCLLELIKKDSGQVRFFGHPLSLKSRSRIGFLPERPQFYEDLTAQECLYFYTSLIQPLSPALKSQIEQGFKRFGLYEWRNKKLKTFSKGMLQKVGLLQAFIPQKDLLILDEPFSGLDPESRFIVADLMEEMLQKGCSLFLSSHVFQDVERVCNRLLVIRKGQIVFEGGIADFQKSSSRRQNIVYILKGKKQNLTVSEGESQKELKRLLSEGAVILSLQSGQELALEEKYKELMKGKKL